MTNEFAAPVTPSNTPRPARRRRDPDDTTPQTAAVVATPPTAAPTTPPPQQVAAPQPPTGLAATHPTGGTLDHVLTPTTTAPGQPAPAPGQQTTSVDVLTGLARMRLTPVDPHKDYVADSTRELRWIANSIAQIANLTGRTRQDVKTRALLGIEPLPTDVLDANWLALYGYPRDQYRPNQ
jgi:hypothetical protein